jgi:hypothetical protein
LPIGNPARCRGCCLACDQALHCALEPAGTPCRLSVAVQRRWRGPPRCRAGLMGRRLTQRHADSSCDAWQMARRRPSPRPAPKKVFYILLPPSDVLLPMLLSFAALQAALQRHPSCKCDSGTHQRYPSENHAWRAEARLRKAQWRQWADEQLQQQERQPGASPVAPPTPPPASADNMSPAVAAAVQRQQPFIRRQPDAAVQPTAAPDEAQAASQGPEQPQPVVHVPAEVRHPAAANQSNSAHLT